MDGGAGGGGPAPFLLKTYEMVGETTTDSVVSWSGSRKSFVVWNPPEFSRVLLPSYFKHNNFSSFIRQLNTYGFRKIDPERWEFANDDFVKDQKHLLKNIHRRKPIHSHSQPQGSTDSERAAFEEEIDKLSHEKSVLEGNISRFKEQQSAVKIQLVTLTERIGNMESRQEKLLCFVEKSLQNPEFVERLAQKLEPMDFSAYNKKRRLPAHIQPIQDDVIVDNQSTGRPELASISHQEDFESMDFSAYNKKRRLPAHIQPIQDNVIVDNQSTCRPELASISHQEDFCNKLRLELSTAVSDVNLLSHSTQSSNEDGASPQARVDEWSKDMHVRSSRHFCPPETLELSDTGTSFNLKMDSSLSCKVGPANDEGDGHLSCLLNLTLASSSPLELKKSQNSIAMSLSSQELCTASRLNSEENNEAGQRAPPTKDRSLPDDAQTLSSSPEVHHNKQGPTTQNRVNDVFWEQFLTERPGCSDTEEASGFGGNAYEEQEERKSGKGIARNIKGIEHLTL